MRRERPGDISRHTRALVVDDERLNRELLVAILGVAGYETVTADDGEEAWTVLDREPFGFDVILLDRRMPRLDGMALMARLKADARFAHLPVIMQTACASSEDTAEGIEAGVTYYLGKPINRKVLLSMVASAVHGHSRFRRLQEDMEKRTTALTLMSKGIFTFRTIAEGETLAVALARAAPKSRSLVIGLSEMFINAVEHGNLGITHEEKLRLVTEGTWQQEIEKRQHLPEYRERNVTVTFERMQGEVRFTIHDEGRGFDWTPHMNLSPERAFISHGRGIAIARRMAFDSVTYLSPGNQVVCTVHDPDAPRVAIGDEAWPVGACQDVDLARTMQAELQPAPDRIADAERTYGLQLSSVLETSCQLGGDLWGIQPIDGRRLALYVADISGHGVPAALNTFRVHAMMEQLQDAYGRPKIMLETLNAQLARLLSEGQYCTMLYGVIDVAAGTFTYAAAAMPAPLVALEAGDILTGDGSGLPLGLMEKATYEERTLALPPHSLLMLASDGLTENTLAHGGSLGQAGATKLIQEGAATLGKAAKAASLLAPLLSSATRPLRDDLLVVCCRHLG